MEGLAPRARHGPSRCPSASPARGPRRGDRRHAHRLRAGRVLPRRQRRHRPGAGGRGLRRRRARGRRAAAARCRCTTAARREAQGFARALDRRLRGGRRRRVVVNAAGCGSTMKEYADLLADDPAYAERARAFADKVRDVAELLAELGPVAAAAPAPSDRRLPRRLPPGARPGRPRASRASCCAASPAWSCGRSPSPSCAAARPASTTSSTPSRPRELGDRKAANIVATGARAAGHRQPGLPDAGRLGDRAVRAPRWRWPTPSRCSTPRSAGSPSSTLLDGPAPTRSIRRTHFNDEVTDVPAGSWTPSATRSRLSALCALHPAR